MDENLLFVYSRYLLQTIFSWSEVKISIVFLKVLKTFIVCLSNSVLNPLRTIYLTVWGVKQCEVESSFYYFMCVSAHIWGFPDGLVIICLQSKRHRKQGFDYWVRKIPWRRAWQPTPVFLPGEPMDRGTQLATVHRDTQSQTRLKRLSKHAHVFHLHENLINSKLVNVKKRRLTGTEKKKKKQTSSYK